MLWNRHRSRLWSVVVAILMTMQLALAFHTLEHKFNLTQTDDCALCQVASNMAPGPSAAPLAAPNLYTIVRVIVPMAPLPCATVSPAFFHSRAPPISVSV